MSEAEQVGASGRKFDDVASLFGSIVPAPGSAARVVRPFKPLVVAVPEASGSAIVPQARSLPEPVVEREPELEDVAQGAVAEPEVPVVRPSVAVPRPVAIPWPDAFEPRPNYRKPEPRNWSWLLLIPIGLAAAFGISMVDARAVKGWIDINLLHRVPIAATSVSTLLPAPFRDGPAAAPVELPPDLTPALPTSPVPMPPGAEVSPPPPAEPVEAAKAPSMHITIQYRRGIPGADGEARRMAALLQGTGGSVELRPNAATVKVPTIMFYNPVDRSSAAALAVTLVNEAAAWTVRQGATVGTGRNSPGSIDIWMP